MPVVSRDEWEEERARFVRREESVRARRGRWFTRPVLAKQREEVLDAIVVTEHVTSLLNVLEANGKLNALDETRFVVKRLLWEEACEMEKRADGSIADGSTTAKNIEDEDDRKWMRETLGKPTNEEERFDIVIGSELAYDERIIPPLLSVIDMFTKENGVVWISVVDRYEKKGVMIECFENEVSKTRASHLRETRIGWQIPSVSNREEKCNCR